jgi:hypothetical protein
MKSRGMKWAGHVACMGERREIYIYTGFWWGDLKERDHLKDPGLDGRIISIPILPTASQHKRMTYTNCCTYRVVPPDDEQ